MHDRTPVPLPAGLLVELDAGPRLDPAEAVRLRRAVAQLSAEHALVGLRVDRVVAFDAAGLGLLLGLHRLARAKGAGLVVVGPEPRLLAALRRRGLHRVLVIEMLPTQTGADDGQPGTGHWQRHWQRDGHPGGRRDGQHGLPPDGQRDRLDRPDDASRSA